LAVSTFMVRSRVSRDSPRTDHETLKINELDVRPERVDLPARAWQAGGRTVNYDTVSMWKGINEVDIGKNRLLCLNLWT
jgi:hypothetical protein